MRAVPLNLFEFGVSLTHARYLREERPMTDELVESFRALLAGEHQDPFIVSYPADWWQHFKQRWFPAWLLRKWPVLKTEIKADVRTLYPKLKTKLPPEIMGGMVTIVVNERHRVSFLPETGEMTPLEWRKEVHEKLFKERMADHHKCPCCSRAWFEV